MGGTGTTVITRAIGADDVDRVAEFLHEHLNRQVPAARWRQLLEPPWGATGPNRGAALWDGAEVVGAYAAVYSRRTPDDLVVCNLAAFCVREPYRAHSLKLVRALLASRDVAFTDLSPSGNVVAMNERLGFRHLTGRTRLVLNVPAFAPRGVHVTGAPAVFEPLLSERDTAIHRDHVGTAARSVVLWDDTGYAYLVYRRDRRKRLAVFASPLYVGGDRALLARSWGAVRAHLLRRGFAAVLAEERILGFSAGPGIELRRPRPRMVRGDIPVDVDYMYSELALLEW